MSSSGSPWILDPSSGEPIDVPIDAEDARYVSSGHLIFLRGSDLHAVRFDLPNLVITGPSVPVLSGVRAEVYNLGQWDVTSDGTLVYAVGGSVAEGRFTWVEADGSRTDLGLPTRARGTFEISPDGTRLAVVEWAPGQNHIWIYDLERGIPRQLTVAGDHAGALAWSPGGTELLYHKILDDTLRAPHVQSVDGGAEPRRIVLDQDGLYAHSWSVGGRLGLEQSDHLILFDPETEDVVDIPNTYPTSWGIVVSPLGDAVAYTSGHTGEYHNYVQPLPPTGQFEQVSLVGGAEEPRWSRDGRLLYYRSGQRIMVATVTTDPELSIGTPTVFFEGDFVNVGFRSYDISLDGTRALIIDGGFGTTTALNVVQGWLAEVEVRIQEAEASGGR
jgi:dipeptidyl aminopeptidase/acylaminoacyl peptidase